VSVVVFGLALAVIAASVVMLAVFFAPGLAGGDR
jgi:hypothetical protein